MTYDPDIEYEEIKQRALAMMAKREARAAAAKEIAARLEAERNEAQRRVENALRLAGIQMRIWAEDASLSVKFPDGLETVIYELDTFTDAP